MKPLFLDSRRTYTAKTAAALVTLSEDADTWPTEILSEVHKQIPYVSEYALNVHMDRVDAERGFGFGHVEVSSKTEVQPKPEAEALVGVQRVRIPLIVKDKMLLPLDTLVTSDAKMLPLTKERMSQAMFRPQLFDVTGVSSGDVSMVSQLYPPNRQTGGGMGGIDGNMMPGGKMASGAPRHGDFMHMQDGDSFVSAKFTPEMFRQFGVKPEGPHPDGPRHYELDGKALRTLDRDPRPSKHASDELNEEIRRVLEKKPAKSAATNIPNSSVPKVTGNTVKKSLPQMKTGSLLEAIRYDVLAQDIVTAAPHMVSLLTKNAASRSALQHIANFDLEGNRKVAAGIFGLIRADVAQLTRDGANEYTVKSASRRCWAPMLEQVDRHQALQRFGEKIVLAADMSGSVTMAEGKDVPSDDGSEAKVITEAGTYKVMDLEGKEITGLVFPNLIDPTTGLSVPSTLFFNGSQAAYQSDIVGKKVGEVTSPATSTPAGFGAWAFSGDEGPVMTLPVTVMGGVPGGEFVIQMADGSQAKYSPPPDAQFVPLQQSGMVALLSSEEAAQTVAKTASSWAEIRAVGPNRVYLSGDAVEKMASVGYHSVDSALFVLAGLGASPSISVEKIAESLGLNAPSYLPVKEVVAAGSAADLAMKTATEKLASRVVLRRDLWKEAEHIPDPMAVDTVLSLGFINQENTHKFIEHLPQLEATMNKLCELLIASRLGLQEISTDAIERTVRTLEEVISGLKVLAFAE